MLKILHTGDIHLDAPFSGLDVKLAGQRRDELRRTFSRIIEYAAEEKVDIMLIAGDLFDRGFVTPETAHLLVASFRSHPECRYVISPGNHDWYNEKSPYEKLEFPDNVYIFKKNTVEKFSFDDISADVYGFAYTAEREEGNPLAAPIETDGSKYNIFVGHCDLTSKSGNFSIKPEDIANTNCDYAALGHIHLGTREPIEIGNTYYAYCGCPEGRSFDECGEKSAILCQMRGDGSYVKSEFSKVLFAKRRYVKLEADVTGVTETHDILEKLRSRLGENRVEEDVMLRVRLTGMLSPENNIDVAAITAQALGVFYIEVKDETIPLLNYEELKLDPTIKGAFFRELLPLLKSEDEKTRKTAARALKYGFSALAGSDVTDF